MKRPLPLSSPRLFLALLSLALLPLPVSGAPADPPYTVTDLGGLSSFLEAYPTAINASGDVVGQSSVPCGPSGFLSCTRPFLYTSSTGQMTQLGVIGDGREGYYSTASGINAGGDAVGTSPEEVPDYSSPGRAVLYTSGGQREFLAPPTPSAALAINDSGLIVGFAGPAPFGPTRAFLYDPATLSLTDIHSAIAGARGSQATAINAGGDVVGWFDSPGQSKRAFLRHLDGSLEVLALPGGLDTDVEATGVNASGQVIGTTNLSSGSQPLMAILWSGGTVEDLGTLEPLLPGAAALGINRQGDVVGGSNFGFECGPSVCFVAWHAFLYRNGVMRDLNDLIPPDSGWVLRAATAINDAGQIVASGTYRSTRSGAVLLTLSADTMVGTLIQLVQGFDLPKGMENSLVTKLEHAQAALAAGDTATACSLLGAFTNETRAQSGKKLTAEQAAEMISRADQIGAVLGCS
jgi:probable HAF family extracellular repeat protein